MAEYKALLSTDTGCTLLEKIVVKRSVLALLLINALAGLANAASDADLPAPPPATPQPSNPRACESVHDFVSSDCSLTWHGITIYGAYDVGVGWAGSGTRTSHVSCRTQREQETITRAQTVKTQKPSASSSLPPKWRKR
jgi:hypothetical protein